MPARAPDSRRSLRRAAFSVSALVLGCVAVELGMRALGLGAPPAPLVQGNVLRSADDSRMLLENQPGGVQRVLYRDRPGAPGRAVVMRVNSQAMRGPEVALERRPGSLRIACLGDSHTFGYGVDEGESWPDVLRARVQAAAPIGSDVLNFGVHASDTEQQAAQLELRVLPYAPDIVLIGYYLNDTALQGIPLEQVLEPSLLVRLAHPRGPDWMRWLRARSRLVDLAADSVHRRSSFAFYARSRSAGYAPDHPGWRRVQSALCSAQALAEEHGFRLGLVLIPFFVRHGDRLGSHAAFEVVKAFCRQQGIEHLDLEPHFAGLDVDALRVHTQDLHATADAHARIGTAVADWLQELAWLPR